LWQRPRADDAYALAHAGTVEGCRAQFVFCFFGLGLLASLVGAVDALAQARACEGHAEVEARAHARQTRAVAAEAAALAHKRGTFSARTPSPDGAGGRRSASMPRARPASWSRAQDAPPAPQQRGERHGSRGSAPAALNSPPAPASPWQPLPPTSLLDAGGVGAQPFLARGAREGRARASVLALWERRAAQQAEEHEAAERDAAHAAAAAAARRGGGGARKQQTQPGRQRSEPEGA
jgi:hypothetical protein